MDRKELYASVTEQVVAQIEAGAGTWRMPWHAIADAKSRERLYAPGISRR